MSTTTMENNLPILSNTLGSKLFNVLPENIILSPLSISFIMALLHKGTIEDSNKQLTKLFGGETTWESINSTYSIMNNDIVKSMIGIYLRNDIVLNKEYKQLAQLFAQISVEDFSDSYKLSNKLNKIIEENTNSLIKDLIKPDMINSDTCMFLINTIYFKALWKYSFKPNDTIKQMFRTSSGQFEVDMMHQNEEFAYFENEQLQYISLPYKGNEYCMDIILPKSLDLPQLTHEDIDNLIKGYHMKYEVNLYLPKFTHRKNISLSNAFKQLGVTDIFENSRANFSNLTSAPVYVDQIIHEAVVIVDEVGTEAAAVTVASLCLESCRIIPTATFRADHPFIYLIRHRGSNTILFRGDYHGK